MMNEKISQTMANTKFALKKASPDILIGAGIAGVICSTVLACAATLKTAKEVKRTKDDLDIIKSDKENGQTYLKPTSDGDVRIVEYTEDMYKKDITKTYAKFTLEACKNYAPAVVVGAASITALISSHNILTKRYAAASSALALVDTAFKDYRKRVREDLGEEADRRYRYGIETEEREFIDDETQKRKTETVEVVNNDRIPYSGYARVFDDTNPNYAYDNDLNMFFLQDVENWANDLLRAKKHLFLNEVYRELGFEETPAGQLIGWTYNTKCPNGANEVDFGLRNIRDRQVRAFINGHEDAIILDFNVDGNILELL